MSETTAFLAGTAVTGLSALLLLKGGLGVGSTMVPNYNPSLSAAPPISATNPTALPQDGWNQSNSAEILRVQLDQQKNLTAQLRTQLEQQEAFADQLRDQLEQQRNESDRVASQLREQQRSVDRLTLQQGLPSPRSGGELAMPQQRSDSTAMAIWVIGGLFVVVVAGGGALLLTVILLSGQQQSRRQSRSQQHYILHNVPGPGPSSPYPPEYPPRYPPARPTAPGQTYTLPPRNVRRVDGDYY